MDNNTPAPERLGEIQDITERAQGGDQTALPRLRELLGEFPQMGEYFGNLATQAEAIWVRLTAGTDLYLQGTVLAKIATLREELTEGSTNPVLRLLVDRVILTWLACNYHCGLEGNALTARENPKLLAFRTKRRFQAERAHLTALAALVTMKKLIPAVAPSQGKEPLALPASVGPLNLHNRISGYFADALGPNSGHKAPVAASN